VIDRSTVAKEYPSFSVELSEDLCAKVDRLFGSISSIRSSAPDVPTSEPRTPPLIWPALLTLHGAACLLIVWEDLGVDPMLVRLVREEFRYLTTPGWGEKLLGTVRIDDITEHAEPEQGIQEQIDLLVEFRNSAAGLLATYHCSYRIPVAVPMGKRERRGR